METDHNIPSEKELKWVAYLNREEGSVAPSPEEQDSFLELEQTWDMAGIAFCHESVDTEAALSRLNQQINQSQPRGFRFLQSAMRYAAMIVVVAGIAFAAYYFGGRTQKPAMEQALISAVTVSQPAEITTVNLPDGTQVQLNAKTQLEYPETFSGEKRIVKLSGEAFFQVAHNAAMPFVIETEGASIEVLGTSFNVSAYPDRNSVEVNVTTGKVRLAELNRNKSEQARAILPAGTSGRIDLTTGTITTHNALSSNYQAWITKEIDFQRTPLGEAFALLEDVYHVKISCSDREIVSMPYTANFANLKIDYIVDVIARTHQLNVTRNEEGYLFSKR